MKQKTEFEIMQAFVESQVIENVDLVLDFLEFSLEANKEVLKLARNTMNTSEYYSKELACSRIQELILRLK